MELSIVLSGPAAAAAPASDALRAVGFVVQPSDAKAHGFEEDASVAYVAAYRPRTDASRPVVSADPERDAADLADALQAAAPLGFTLRLHGHRPRPVESDEARLRRVIREVLAQEAMA